MERPVVSVLFASYNHAPYVEAAVRSVMVQQGVSFELLAIDDGSTEESPAILERLSREFGFSFVSRPNRGLVPTLNELLSKAQGTYICTLASDDVMPPDRLKMQSDVLDAHPEWAACFGQVRFLYGDGRLSRDVDPRYARGIPGVSFEELLLGTKEIHGCTEMVRREKLETVGGYSEKFRIEDYPLWLALSHRYGTLPVLPSVHCHYRVHGESMHRRLDLIYSQVLEIIADYQDEPLYAEAVRRWKANWFSAWAYEDKVQALRHFFRCFSLSRHFLKRLPKLLIPKRFLKY